MTDAEMAEAVRLAWDAGTDEACWCRGRGHFDENGKPSREGRPCIGCDGGRLGKVARALIESQRQLAAATARAERAEADARSCWSSADADHVRTTERARVVEAIAAWHDKASNIDSSHGNSGQAFAHALSADHIRSHNWAPPEEDGDE